MNMKCQDGGQDGILDRMAQGMRKERKRGVEDDTMAFGLSNWKNRVHYLERVDFGIGSNMRKYQEVLDRSLFWGSLPFKSEPKLP